MSVVFCGPKPRQTQRATLPSGLSASSKLGDPEAVPKLIHSLRSNSSEVRLKAVALIKEFKDKRTIDILKYKMKYDQNAKVRSEAKKALEELGVNVNDEKK